MYSAPCIPILLNFHPSAVESIVDIYILIHPLEACLFRRCLIYIHDSAEHLYGVKSKYIRYRLLCFSKKLSQAKRPKIHGLQVCLSHPISCVPDHLHFNRPTSLSPAKKSLPYPGYSQHTTHSTPSVGFGPRLFRTSLTVFSPE